MRNLLILLVSVLLLSSCQQEGDFSLNFKAIFEDEALMLNQAYELDDIDLKFENLSFFLSDISIINDKGEEVLLSDIELLQLNSFDQEGAESGQTITYNDLPSGTYRTLKFGIGVPDDLNTTVPGDYQVDQPLGRSDMYWENWASYIFSKTEGNADVDGNGVFDLKFFYHTGSDALYRTFELPTNLSITKDGVSTIELFLDFDEMLRNADGTALDIEQFPRNHDPDKLEIVTQYVNNYQNAIKVRQ